MLSAAIRITACSMLFCAATSAHSAPVKYAVDPSHTSIIFGISHMGFSYTYGRFNKSTGTVMYDADQPGQSTISLTIDTASIDSADQKRDEHLRSADFFNVKQFPEITFQTTGIEVSGGCVAGDGRDDHDGGNQVGNISTDEARRRGRPVWWVSHRIPQPIQSKTQ